MMRLFVLIILFCAGIHLYAQVSDTPLKWSAGIFFSPDFSHRFLSVNDEDFEWLKKERDENEKARLGYHAGYDMQYSINKRMSASLGLVFYDSGWKTTYKEPLATGSQLTITKKYRLSSFLAGISYSFTEKDKKLKPWFSLGVGLNGIIDSKSIYLLKDEIGIIHIDVLKGENDIQKILLSLHAGILFKYKLSEKYTAFYYPGISCFPTSTVDAVIGEHLCSFNNRLGLGICF